MMRMSTKPPTTAAGLFKVFVPSKDYTASIPVDEPAKWEVLPSGMLVQKRNSDESAAAAPIPTIRLRVKHGSICHEIYISSQATFGELKKLLAERTGLHPLDQKIMFKEKERDSTAFLDISGVKDRSKMVVVMDPASQAKRLLDMRRAVELEKSAKSISHITLEVDKLASQVSALERVIFKGGKVTEDEVLRLIELLMNELLKLDGVTVDGGIMFQSRRVQVRRVQSYVETLDLIVLKNTMSKAYNSGQAPPQQQRKKQSSSSPQLSSVNVSTNFEALHTLFSPGASASTSMTTTASSTAASSAAPTPRFDWELF